MGERRRRSSLSRRLISSYALVFLGTIGLFVLLIDSGARGILAEDLGNGLVEHARLVAGAEDPAGRLAAVGAVTGARATVVDAAGTIVADTGGEVGRSLAGRAEVDAALAGEVGRDRGRRPGEGERLAVAVPVPDGGAVRLSVPGSRIADDLAALRESLLLAALIAGIIGLLSVWASARRIARPLEVLTTTASALAAGDRSRLPRPSAIAEIEQLGAAVDRLAGDLGRRVEESVRERDTLEGVLDALPQGVILVDADDRIAYANSAAVSLVGAVPDRLALVAPHTLQRLVRAARTGAAEGEEIIEAGRGRSLRAAARGLAGGERVVVVVDDVTDRLRLDAIRRDFVSDASHELKTPVAAIIAATEGLRLAVGRDPGRVDAFAGRVEDSARQLGRIVADLLDLSRLESSDMPTDPVVLDEVVAVEVAAAAPRAAAAGIELVTRLTPVAVTGSPADLALAVRNLCDNALRYTDRGGTVTVGLRREGRQAIVEVADTGAGIPGRALPRIFERFYKVDVAHSRATGGTGLGLAIVKHVAERHGGTVTVTSELGVGSTFRVSLPLPPDPDAE